MGTVKCPNKLCGKIVSDQFSECPFCHSSLANAEKIQTENEYDQQNHPKKNTKTVLVAIIVLLLCIFVYKLIIYQFEKSASETALKHYHKMKKNEEVNSSKNYDYKVIKFEDDKAFYSDDEIFLKDQKQSTYSSSKKTAQSAVESNADEFDLNSFFIYVAKQFNEQLPIQPDECTTHKMCYASGKTMIIKTIIPDECDEYVDYDEFKNKMSHNYSVTLDRNMVSLLASEGYSIVYIIFNENDYCKRKVTIKFADILKQY